MGVTSRSWGAVGRSIGRPAATLGERGKWGAGRRPAPHAFAALLVLLAMGTCTALFTPSPVAAQAEGDPAASAPAAPPDTPVEPNAQPTDPTPPQPPAVQSEDPPAEEAPTPPQWDAHATYDVPPSAADAPRSAAHLTPAPTDSAPPDGDAAQEPAPDPGSEEPSQASGTVAAQNVGRVFQAIWQVQVGCRTYCDGTSQTQWASQQSDTTQSATAIAPEGQSSGAAAVNQSSTVQFVWQTQLGCVAFCWNTSMNQSASQDAQTTQMATAVSDFGALAENVAETLQYIWQVQEGCEVECYGVNESQSVSQSLTTHQSATATGPPYPTSAGWRPDSPESFFSWVTAFAQNVGATVQRIFQHQEAGCLEHCGEEALVQAAAQRARTDQIAAAGDVPEPVSEPPSGPEPPPAEPDPPAAGESPPGSAPSEPPTVAAAAMTSATNSTGLAEAPPRGRDSVSLRAGHRQSAGGSSRGSEQASVATAQARVSGALAPESGTDAARSRPAAETSNSHDTSSTESRSSAANAVFPAPVTPDRSGYETPNDPTVPWLPVALLFVAGVAVIQTLRLRPGFGA
jgi:hypothetical protein